jgi:succinyl-CoA synthetase beta subunit
MVKRLLKDHLLSECFNDADGLLKQSLIVAKQSVPWGAHMKLHEYQAKDLLRKRGVFVLDSRVCFTLEQAKHAIKELGVPCMIKAQVHAGGRGKAGGVKLARTADEAYKFAENILAMTIRTEQTGPAGQKVSSILVEQACTIQQELYISILVDRETSRLCLLASKHGGVDIEEIARVNPANIVKLTIAKSRGLMPYQLREIAVALGLMSGVKKNFHTLIHSVYRTFIECDASMIEINPLVITDDDRIIALDAKMIIDDNALYRQRSISELRDPSQEDPKEIEAQHHGLSYVALDGNIGCMVNGAGLAMATMDVIKHVGGKPANFLDVGGSATAERVEEALRIIARDSNVKSIFINVFGGIAQCDVIARGVVKAMSSLNLSLPLIVRLQGTNVEQGRDILNKSGLTIITATTMLEGARAAVAKAS